MAFESNTLVNGEWTTRVLDVNTVLRHYDQQDKDNATNLVDVEKTPKFGLLTQTVIRSPLVHWILPVRLRDSRIHDVAFIGDDFVQIKELRSDGLLWEVVRKEDFGARIRNAAVIGSISAYEQDPDVKLGSTQVKSEEEENGLGQEHSIKDPVSSARQPLPPQFLVLQLETGDSIFLMLQVPNSRQPRFVTSRYRVSKAMLRLQPGTHIAVDPTSRYMVVSCSEKELAIYELQNRATLKQQLSQGQELKHIVSSMHFPVMDVIVKIDFLHPTPGDEDHIILLAIVIRKGKTRMLMFEWDSGDNIIKIKPRSVKGHTLDNGRQMPLLLIPLTIRSAFILVFENSISICEGMASDHPVFKDLESPEDIPTPPSDFHNGLGVPLWTSWTRPARRPDFLSENDHIYITREDGWIKFLDFNKHEDALNNDFGQFHANCGTAFASLDFKQATTSSIKSGDLLVIGGDSGSGGTYLVEARGLPIPVEPVQNWTPAHDFVTTYASSSEEARVNGKGSRNKEVVPKPDRIFACVGKGITSTIAEFRYGLEARIGLNTDYETPILQSWVLPAEFEATEDNDTCLFLLSMGDSSAVLSLSGDAAEIVELDESATRFDLRHRTIAVVAQETAIVQVTEGTIGVIGHDFVHKYSVSELPGIMGRSIDNATIGDNAILFTTYLEGSVHLQVLEHGMLATNMDLDESANVRVLRQTSLNVTSMIIGEIAQAQFGIVAEWTDSFINLTFQSLAGGDNHVIDLLTTLRNSQAHIDAVVSLAMIPSLGDSFLLLCGSRNGLLITLEISAKTFEVLQNRVDRVGATSAVLTRDNHAERGNTFFINCDSKLYHLQPILSGKIGEPTRSWRGQPHTIHQIWLSDASDSKFRQPVISGFAQLTSLSSISRLSESLLLVSGSMLFLADLSVVPKAVPRHIPLVGTPTRLLYSHTLDALIVAASIGKLSTLQFIDPETGEDMAQPIDQETKLPVEFVSGLGNPNEKIFRVFEWAYKKHGKLWNYLIVATSLGRVLIISVDQKSQTNGNRQGEVDQGRQKISYYTRHRFKSIDPVYSVTGFPEGLLWCTGDKLFCDMLDLTKKKFVRAAEYDLPSPAINLEYKDGTIFALTKCHSLEVLRLVLNETNPNSSQIIRNYGDQLTRDALHHTMLVFRQQPVHLVSDKSCSLVGLWPITGTKADTLEAVFEAELPNSILRFRSAKCRPIWDSSWNGTNRNTNGTSKIQSSPEARNPSETLGLSITGSLSHFTMLQLTAWKYLRFLIDLAILSPQVCEFTYKDGPVSLTSITDPKLRMQIDGDILKRCLVGRHLESLLRLGQNTSESKKVFERFCELLQDYHGGNFPMHAGVEAYLEQAYTDLNYFLRPIL
ncbi:uncharacterized protein PAC_12269 [Phialocephala subalpina]|uniref:Uncharacterized protein n=1 Tax=Phialocephala subalpina TaxID=576137 RepID=A0A1L7XBH3_9HELO|nr:uncharacterized protein PAC_12269 [Phialocephala subalpina]